MIICKNCNFQFENTEFCPNCGTPVAVVAETPIVEQVTDEPVVKEEVINDTANEVESNDTILIDEPIAEEKPAVDPGLSLGKISLVLGIIALVSGTICSCIFACLGGSLPFVCAVVSIVISILALNKSKDAGFTNKKATTGLILSIATIIVIIIFVIFNGILGAAMRPILEEIMYELY